MAENVARMEEGKNAFKIITANGNRKETSREDRKEISVNTMNWIDSARDWDDLQALMNVALNLRVP
jgi:hypothetical protein